MAASFTWCTTGGLLEPILLVATGPSPGRAALCPGHGCCSVSGRDGHHARAGGESHHGLVVMKGIGPLTREGRHASCYQPHSVAVVDFS